MYVCMYVCICVCVYMYMYVCVYVYVLCMYYFFYIYTLFTLHAPLHCSNTTCMIITFLSSSIVSYYDILV